MRPFLAALYRAALWLAALALVAIAVLVLMQVGARLLDSVLKLFGARPTNFVILSLTEIAGYLLATASFLALAATLKAGAHIRVTMLLQALGERARRPVEAVAFAVGATFSGYMAWFVGRLAYDSWRFNEISPGLVPVPLVWPQAAMTAGLVVLAIAFLDELVAVALTGRPSFRAAEDAATIGKEG